MTKDINDMYWHHSIALPDGRVTNGVKNMQGMTKEFGMTFDQLDLTNKSVLDVGAWNGGFSLEAWRRGANKITALDSFVWESETFKGRETIELVIDAHKAPIDLLHLDIGSQTKPLVNKIGQYDVVLFLGVFYHLVDPIAALKQVSDVAKECLVVETYLESTGDELPSMRFFPGSELGDDETNWWGPNEKLIVDLLKLNGFSRINFQKSWEGKPTRGVFHAYR